MLNFEHDSIPVEKIKSPAVMYFNGSIYRNPTASSDDIISSLSSMIYDSVDPLKTQAAITYLMCSIQMRIDSIKEKHCS